MSEQPRITEREAEPYVAIRSETASEAEFRRAVDSGYPRLFGWLAENGVSPTGAPFIRFHEVDDDGQPLAFELAAPVAETVDGGDEVVASELPAGRYATLLHVGPFSHDEVPDLAAARAELLAWIERQGLEPASSASERGVALRAYVERYLTDPSSEPDWSKWETELAYLVAER